MATPATTRAIIVGVETYGLGEDWNLPGPVNDAIRFAEWLLQRGVPPGNIRLLLSPHAPTTARGDPVPTDVLPLPAGLTAKDACRPTIRRAFKDLSTNPADLLYVYWGGHGFQHQREHHLLCQDAQSDDLQNINRINIAEWLRSNSFPAGPDHQIWFIDTCAKNTSRLDFSNDIPDEKFPIGDSTVESRRQQIVLSAARGLGAKNDSLQRRGVFSDALMELLPKKRPMAWPPDMDALRDKIISRFDELRASDAIDQEPEFVGDWRTAARRTPRAAPSTERILQINVAPSLQPSLPGRPADASDAYRVTAHLWRGDTAEELSGIDTGACVRSDLDVPVRAAIERAFRLIGRGTGATLARVDFVLPSTLLDTPFDQVVLKAGLGSIGRCWPAVVRSYERLFADDGFFIAAAQESHRRWRAIADDPALAARVGWLPKPCENTFLGLVGLHSILAALRLRPEGVPPPSPLLAHLAASDLPVAVWLHDHGLDEPAVRAWLEQHLVPEKFLDWPRIVHSLRRQTLPAHADPKPCSGLTLFWDDPDHVLCPVADLQAPTPV